MNSCLAKTRLAVRGGEMSREAQSLRSAAFPLARGVTILDGDKEKPEPRIGVRIRHREQTTAD